MLEDFTLTRMSHATITVTYNLIQNELSYLNCIHNLVHPLPLTLILAYPHHLHCFEGRLREPAYPHIFLLLQIHSNHLSLSLSLSLISWPFTYIF